MEKWKLRRGDFVQVIAGKHKNSKGEIVRVDRVKRWVYVRGVNIVTKYRKPTAGEPGGILKEEGHLDVSNVMFIDTEFGRPTKLGFKFDEAGKKVRYCKLSGNIIK